MSQLELSAETGVSQRHISFIESGRSVVGRQTLLSLARALDVPLREQNSLLLAAGYAPIHPDADLDAPSMRSISDALIRVTETQADAAATRFRSAASDPQAASDALNTATVNAVPAAPLTTYQVTGDQGLGGLERGVSQADNAPFIDLKNRQNAARVEALGTIPPADASTADVGSAFRQQLADLDAYHQADVDGAVGRVQSAVSAMGPTPTGSADSAQQQFGQQLRTQLDAANQAAKAREGALWNIVGAGGAGAGAYLFGPLGAGLGSQLGKALPGLQATNIKTVNDLIREAVLRPEVARVLLSRVTPQNASTIGATLAARLRGAAVTGAAVGSEQPSRPPLNALMSAGRPSPGPPPNPLLH